MLSSLQMDEREATRKAAPPLRDIPIALTKPYFYRVIAAIGFDISTPILSICTIDFGLLRGETDAMLIDDTPSSAAIRRPAGED